MVTIKKILCPTDFSDASYKAIEIANGLALKLKARLYLLHVMQDIPPLILSTSAPVGLPSAAPPPLAFDVKAYRAEQKKQTKSSLDDVIKKKISKKLKVQVITTCGSAVDEIVRIAKKQKIDLIVIATHGRSGFKHLLLGSVTEKVVRLSSCPVLTVRHKK